MRRNLLFVFVLALFINVTSSFGHEHLQASDVPDDLIIEIEASGADFLSLTDDGPDGKAKISGYLTIVGIVLLIRLAQSLYLQAKPKQLPKLLTPVFYQSNYVVCPPLKK